MAIRKLQALPSRGNLAQKLRVAPVQPQGPDWLHPSVEVYRTEEIGLGILAMDLIPHHATVILFGGDHMSWREVLTLPEEMQDIPYQVGDDVFFGIRRAEDIGPGERINHSCNPNVGFASEMRLVALRDILPGEPITMDYATCTSMESYRLTCRCGSPFCRGVVTGNDWKLPALRERLGNFYQPYLKEKVREISGGNLRGWVARGLRSLAHALDT